MDLITNWGGESHFNSQLAPKMNFIATFKNQPCYPCDEKLCFIKLKQVLNYKVHNLGETATRFLFRKVLVEGGGNSYRGPVVYMCL